MAIKVYDGFDHYGTQADMQARAQQNGLQWSDIPAGQITFVAGRGGYGYAAEVAGSLQNQVGVGASFNANYSAGYCGIATLIAPGGPPFVDYMLMDYSNQACQVCLRCYADAGTIQAYAGDPSLPGATYLGASPPNAFSPFVWNKIEVYGSISASGAFTVNVNGAPAFSMTSVATQAPTAQLPSGMTANPWFNGFKVRFAAVSQSGVPAGYLDDFNANDTTTGPGTYPCNGFLGDVATRTLFAIGNQSVQWTPKSGTNYQMINETAFDGDSTYNTSGAVGDTDLFDFGTLPTDVSVVFAVQVTGGYRKLDAGAQTIAQSIVSSGTTSAGAAKVMSLGYTYLTDLFVLDPHTGATWTPTAVNALVAGYTQAS